jgi:hypothetical protein
MNGATFALQNPASLGSLYGFIVHYNYCFVELLGRWHERQHRKP